MERLYIFIHTHIQKPRKITKRCPEYISSVVEVSSCSYQKTVYGFSSSSEIVLSEIEFLSFVTILVFDF